MKNKKRSESTLELNAPIPPWSFKNLGVVIGIIIVINVIYEGSHRNEFVYWDDDKYVLEDEHVKSLSLPNILSMFFTPNTIDYRPLVTLSYAVNYKFGGFDPTGYHYLNLLFHLLSTIALYFLILKLSRSHFVAAVVTTLFGIHPMNVESVAWVTERKDVLYVFFYLLSMLAYIGYWFKDRKKRLWLTFFFFICSLCSKGMAITLPFALLLLDYYNGRRKDVKVIKEKIPFFVFAFLLCLVTLHTQSNYIEKYHPDPIEQIPYQLFFSTHGIVNYVGKLVIPWKMSAAYPFPERIHGEYPAKFFWSLVIIPIIPWLLWRVRRRRKIMFGLLFLLINIFLPIVVVPFGQTFLGDRFTYLAGVGIYLVGAILLEDSLKRYEKQSNFILIAMLAYFLVLAGIARERTKVWENTTTLFEDVVSKFPNDKRVYTLAARAINASGNHESAIQIIKKPIEATPQNFNWREHIQLAYYYYKNNNLDSALMETNLLLEYSDDEDYCSQASRLYDRSKIYTKMRKKKEAWDDFNESFRLSKILKDCRFNSSDSVSCAKEIMALPN